MLNEQLRNMSDCTYTNQSTTPNLALLLNGPLTTLCTIMGLIGNVFTIKLARNMHIGKVLRNYMVGLALWDSAVLISTFFYYGLHSSMEFVTGLHFEQKGFWAYLMTIFNGLLAVSITGSTWTAVAIAFTRYFIVLCPLQTVTFRAFTHSAYLNMAICICGILYCIPCFLELKLEDCYDRNTDDVTVEVWPWLLYSKKYQIVYRTICYTLFVSLGPFIAILIMSVHTIYLLRKRNNRRTRFMPRSRSIDRTNRSHWRVGILFFVLLGKFLICYTIPTILMLWYSFVGGQLFKTELMKTIADIGNFLVVLNSASNVLVYTIWQKYGTNEKEKEKLRVKGELSNTMLSNASDLQLTPFEINILCKSWQDTKKWHGAKIFTRLVMYLFEEHENIMDIQTLPNLKRNILLFFDTVVSEICNGTTHKIPSNYIQQIGRTHRQHGVKLTNEVLRNFKVFLLEEIFNRRTSQGKIDLLNVTNRNVQSAEIRIWNRILSAIIAEMKLGYMATPKPPQRHLLAVNQGSSTSSLLTESNSMRDRKFTL